MRRVSVNLKGDNNQKVHIFPMARHEPMEKVNNTEATCEGTGHPVAYPTRGGLRVFVARCSYVLYIVHTRAQYASHLFDSMQRVQPAGYVRQDRIKSVQM